MDVGNGQGIDDRGYEMSEKLLEEWKKHDPFLTDLEGFQRFVERVQRFEELHSQTTTCNEDGWGPKEIKKYRGIWAVFACRTKEDPRRFCGLFFQPIDDLTTFDYTKGKYEKRGDIFLCFQVMHEKTLDHHPERPHIKGTFAMYDYYNYDWEPIPRPEMMKKIEKHLNRVSRWYNKHKENEPYPTPPLWEGGGEKLHGAVF